LLYYYYLRRRVDSSFTSKPATLSDCKHKTKRATYRGTLDKALLAVRLVFYFMKVVHISDTHGMHHQFSIPECDLLIHSGDIGETRLNPNQLTEFLIWFEAQPARCKVFVGGNHDLCLDRNEANKYKGNGETYSWLKAIQDFDDSMKVIQNYDVHYLNGKDYVFEGMKIWGSPYSPSFHRSSWAFNADRGNEIMKKWGSIPSDVNILVTHTPCYGILDDVKEYAHDGENPHKGCADLLAVIKKRLYNLRLHCGGHIHDNFGVELLPISNTRRCLFSNGAMINNRGEILINTPVVITL
jgi:Icc-related predicted phosphoesterase